MKQQNLEAMAYSGNKQFVAMIEVMIDCKKDHYRRRQQRNRYKTVRRKLDLNADIGVIYNEGLLRFQTVDFILKVEHYKEDLLMATFEKTYEEALVKRSDNEKKLLDDMKRIGKGNLQGFLYSFFEDGYKEKIEQICPKIPLDKKEGVMGNIRGKFLEVYCKNAF